MKNILLIEDEENLNRGISLKLKKEGYAVFSAACVSEGLKLFQDNTIDLVICDIGLPDGSGLDLCANIRQRSDVLFLFLTALDTEVDVITGYEMGADDYVTKPFSMSVLVSKISAMLKRTEKAVSNIVQTGKLTFYIDEKRVVKGDNAISITPTDWKLLMAFIEHPHHILSRKQLLERLWDSNTDYVDPIESFEIVGVVIGGAAKAISSIRSRSSNSARNTTQQVDSSAANTSIVEKVADIVEKTNRSLPCENDVSGHKQRYHTKNGVIWKNKAPYHRGGNNG